MRCLGMLLFFCLLCRAQEAPDESIADILAGGAAPEETTQRPSSAPSVLDEWMKDYRAVAEERTRLAELIAAAESAVEACRDRACATFRRRQLLELQLQRNARMLQFRDRVLGYRARCGEADPCAQPLQRSLAEAEEVIARQRSATVIQLAAPLGIAGIVLSAVVIAAATAAAAVAFSRRAESHIVLLAACVLVFSCFRLASWGTVSGIFGIPVPYAAEATERLAALALMTSLAVLAHFWGRPVHEELLPSRRALLVSQAAVIAIAVIVSLYGFIMCFIAPNFPVPDASFVLVLAADFALSALLVAYAAIILHSMRRAVPAAPEAVRNSAILLGLACCIVCFSAVVLAMESYWTADKDLLISAVTWFQVARLAMEFLIAAALLAIVVLSVWSQFGEAVKRHSCRELDAPLVPRRYEHY